MSLLLSRDPVGRKRTVLHHAADGAMTFETVQDVQPIADVAQALYNSASDYGPSRWAGDHHRVATIPMPMLMELDRIGIARDAKAFLRWLDHPDNRLFRCKPGRLV